MVKLEYLDRHGVLLGYGFAPLVRPPGSSSTSVPQMPVGRKSTKAMKMRPITSGQRSVNTASRSPSTR